MCLGRTSQKEDANIVRALAGFMFSTEQEWLGAFVLGLAGAENLEMLIAVDWGIT